MLAVERHYYEVLGVPPGADQATIARAFDQLSRDCHPAVTDDPGAEQRFRELAEAYSVLSRPEARELYDRSGFAAHEEPLYDEVVAEGAAAPPRGENVHLDLDLRHFEARNGTKHVVRYGALVRCSACMGLGRLGSPEVECKACNGKGTIKAEQRLRLIIPPGVEDEAQLRIPGEGDDAGSGSVRGDLLVHIHIRSAPRDPRFIRYLAFVLLVLAVATLAIYLLR